MSDNLTTQSGAPLELSTHTGNILNVHISTTTSETGKRGTVAFKATASGALPGESVKFTWDFGDGTTGTGASITHQYESKGTYRIVARAEGDQDSAGSSNLLKVSAAGPEKNPGGGAGNGSNHGGNGPGFGDGDQGPGTPDGDKNTGELEAGPSSGPDADVGAPAVVPPYSGSYPSYPSYPTAPVEPLAPDSPSPSPSAATPPRPEDAPPTSKAPKGEPVVGKLLSAETPVAAGVPSTPPEAAASAIGNSPTSVWTPVGLGAGTLLLICAGAGLELRSLWGSFRMHP